MNTCRQTKELLGNPRAKAGKIINKLSRKKLQIIVGAFSDLCEFNRRLRITDLKM